VGVPGGGSEVLIESLKYVAKNYPAVRIQLQYMTTGLQIEALREGRIHVGFLNLPVHEPALTLETVRKEPLCIAMPKGHPLARYQTIPISELKGQSVIMFLRRVAPGLHDEITTMCRDAGFTVNAIHETDNVVAGLTLVSAELGISFCTPSIRRLWPDLIFRPVRSPICVEQAVAYRRDVQSPVLGIFLRVVRQIARRRKAKGA
jgi:DNA-binding transcriptional LysR family regulator